MIKKIAVSLIVATLLATTVQAKKIHLYNQNKISSLGARVAAVRRFGTNITILSNRRLSSRKARRLALRQAGAKHTIMFHDGAK